MRVITADYSAGYGDQRIITKREPYCKLRRPRSAFSADNLLL